MAAAWKQIVGDAATITSPSAFLAGLIHRSIDVPVHIGPNGCSAGASRRRDKRNMILVVARLIPRKGVEHFIDAVRDLPADWELVIAGDGPRLSAPSGSGAWTHGDPLRTVETLPS